MTYAISCESLHRKKSIKKLDKSQTVFDKFGQYKNTKPDNQKVIILFVLPCHKASDAVLKYQTITKIQAKLENLEKKKEPHGLPLRQMSQKTPVWNCNWKRGDIQNNKANAPAGDLKNLNKD